jgi:hypothetical protein
LQKSGETGNEQTGCTEGGYDGDEVMGEWRKSHSGELHNLYSSPNIIRQIKSKRMRWAGYVACVGEERKVYKVLMVKPEGKRDHLERRTHSWEDGLQVDPRKIGWEGVKWSYLTQDRNQW